MAGCHIGYGLYSAICTEPDPRKIRTSRPLVISFVDVAFGCMVCHHLGTRHLVHRGWDLKIIGSLSGRWARICSRDTHAGRPAVLPCGSFRGAKQAGTAPVLQVQGEILCVTLLAVMETQDRSESASS